MTVAELIKALEVFDPNEEVRVYTGCHGCEGSPNRVAKDSIEFGAVWVEA